MYNVSDTYKELIKAPVRYTGISGAVRLRDGTIIHLTDDNIAAGSLSITQKMNGRGDFRPGGVYSGELSCSLKGFAGKTSDIDGAVIRLAFILYHDSDMQAAKSETVPLGRFYVDGSSIKRRNDTVTLSAFDGMVLFDVESTERSGTLYELVCGACTAAGVSFGMSQAAFEALPNGTQSADINTARVQTERDLLMYVGMMTGSFARVNRSNELEFVPLTCERDDKGMIIPVREIAGNIRFSTDFSDDTTRIAKLFTRRNGAAIYSTVTVTPGGSEKLATMELNENPLLSELSDDEVSAVLNNELLQIYECLNRVFDSGFTGDPALDVGDYVRLRGGAIDTDRGYATGMITSQIWRYRGQHTIKCTMPSSLSAAEDTAVQTYALGENSSDTNAAPVRTQPKSQLQKQIDELRGSMGSCDGKLHDIAGTTAEARLVSGSPYASRIIGTNPDGNEMFEVGNSGGNIILSGEGAELMLSAKRGTIDIHAGNNRYGIGIGPSSVSISAGNGHTLSFSFDGAGVSSLTITPPSGYGKAFTIRCGNDGYSNTSISVPGHILEFDGDEGLLYNGKRVLTEDIKT